MGKAIDRDRALRLMGIYMNNVSFDGVSDDTVEWAVQNPKEAGAEFSAFLRNRGKLIVGEPKILRIDRSTPFDPKFIGDRWSIDEEDERSIALNEIDLTSVRFETTLKSGENSIQGENKLKRLKDAGHIRLDAKVFLTLWEKKHMIPETWKRDANGEIRHIYFDGTVLRGPDGGRRVLYLFICEDYWRWGHHWLAYDWHSYDPSALLA